MNYTLHQLRVFQVIAKKKSITRASEALHLTQPAVSIQLKKLQDQFELPLTQILGRQLYLTKFGEKILEICNDIIEKDQQIKHTTNQFKGLLTGDVTISVVSTGKYVLPYFLKDFMVKYPHVDVSIQVSNRQDVIKKTMLNQNDISLVSILPKDLKINHYELMPNHLMLVKSKKLTKELNNKSLREIFDGQTHVLREKGSATRKTMEAFLEKHNIKPLKTITLVSNEAVKQAVLANLGISIMPLIGLKNELTNGSLKIIKTKHLPIENHWNLIHLKEKHISIAAKTLLKMINESKSVIINNEFDWVSRYLK